MNMEKYKDGTVFIPGQLERRINIH